MSWASGRWGRNGLDLQFTTHPRAQTLTTHALKSTHPNPPAKMKSPMSGTEEFYRIQKLPPYVFAVLNEMRAKARAAQMDVVDLGMGNPDGETPKVVVDKLCEAARNPRNHRYSLSRGIPKLREEICARYKRNYDVD